ncbi:hypothetical protein [Hasllibacter sp. MH4015]|uniref:hypothetical protein n=1 Tax=Hasllibacter sp. MH4015 TaxID=2854029 RepID=UPI001CD6DD0C|nr:hypothetical protein [Hasllibacter sp. MH4015]
MPHDARRPRAASSAIALPRPGGGLSRPGFFPKAPGPGLIVFAIALGILPSAFAIIVVLGHKLEAGFYMDADFIWAQHRWLLMVASFVTVPALIALFFVLRALRGETRDRGPLIGVALALVATICWDWIAAQGLRSLLNPVITTPQIEAVAERMTLSLPGLDVAARVDGAVFVIEYMVPEDAPVEQFASLRTGPAICTELGAMFSGPVAVVSLRITRPDGATVTSNVGRADCRAWYLRERVIANRPRPLGAQSAGSLLVTLLHGR